MIIRKTFLFLAVLVLCVPALAFAQDVNLTSDGKVPGKPFVYLQEQIDNIQLDLDEIVSSPWMIYGSDISFDGNIGIGTPGPSAELEVNGTVAASAFSSTSPLILEAPIGTERMRIDDLAGNVGIGTTNPLAPFHVVSSVTWPTLPIFTENNHDSRTGAGINMRKSRGTPTLKTIVESGDILGAVHFFGYDRTDYKNAASVMGIVEGLPAPGFIPGRLHFLTNNGTTDMGAVRMVINSSGNVGIGTTSPSAPFHVNASVTFPTLPLLSDNSVNDQTGAGISMRKSRGTPASKEKVVNGDFLGAVHFFGYDGDDYQRASSIAGRVDGVPGVPGSGNMPGRLVFSTNNGTSILERMRIDNSGNVGIGTTIPNYPLEMGSGAHVTTGGVWTNASSRDYKENIRDLTIEEAEEALEKLRPTKFNYKVEGEDEYVGFIAEDVPELVATKDRKSLSPMDIVAVLTKVVKKQQDEIKQLKIEKGQIKETLTAFADRQNALEDMFLAISTNLPKEKLVKYDNAGLDEVQKTIQ